LSEKKQKKEEEEEIKLDAVLYLFCKQKVERIEIGNPQVTNISVSCRLVTLNDLVRFQVIQAGVFLEIGKSS
jgi:ribosomal protein L21